MKNADSDEQMQIPKAAPQIPWFLPIDELYTQLLTSPEGLSTETSTLRLEHFGHNSVTKKESTRIVTQIVKQCLSPLVVLLLGAAVLTGFLHEWLQMSVIFFAVVLNVSIAFFQEHKAENTLRALISYLRERTRVVRDGVEREEDAAMLVPGDIIVLAYGMRVPADARLIHVQDFRVDEAVLTGESLPVTKEIGVVQEVTLLANRSNMVFAGTLVTEGYAHAVVTATGNETELGRIASIVSSIHRVSTPIQKGVNQLSWYIFLLTIAIVVGLFLLGMYRGEPLIDMLILSAAVAVGAVPEALPIALTVILAVGASRIAAKKGIVRQLAAAETLGSTTVVLTDKTGTLTEANMQLVGIHPLPSLTTYAHKAAAAGLSRLSAAQKNVLTYALANCDVIVENAEAAQAQWTFSGRPFEIAIARVSAAHHIPLVGLTVAQSNIRIPFNSTHKFSVAQQGARMIVMGAPDILLSRAAVDKDTYVRVQSWIKDASFAGNRLVAVGTFTAATNKKITIDDVSDISFEGILSFFDPVRKDAPEALRRIAALGVRAVMVTGDLVGTARSVAQELGWHVEDSEILTGADLKSMSDAELAGVVQRIKIFARVTPEDKLRIGSAYRALGEIVAMTGDGVNDAPALKAMDIGISLGSGTDVAKNAADLVLLDDNFSTITAAIEEGRRMLANIRKTFVYLMSNAFDEVIVVGGSLLVGIVVPLTPLQIIWVNLATGSLPALAFAFDDIDDSKKGNKGVAGSLHTQLLNGEIRILALGLGLLSSLLLFVLYYGLVAYGVENDLARSIFFACFSGYILAVAFSFRSTSLSLFSYNPFSNRMLNGAIGIAALVLIATMTVPFLRDTLSLVPIPYPWLALIALWIVFNVAIVECVKWAFRLRARGKA